MRHAALALVLLAGCATDSGHDFDLDEEAADEVAAGNGKADGISFERLERSTVAEVAASFKAERTDELVRCFAAYTAELDPDATTLSADVTSEFLRLADITDGNACEDWSDLEDTVQGVLAQLGLTEAPIGDVIDALDDFATAKLADATTDGFVDVEKAPLLFSSDIHRTQDANAVAREQDPTNIDLTQIREAWNEVAADQSPLDSAYLNPVVFPRAVLDGDDIFKGLRSAFPLKGLSLSKTGKRAVDAFWHEDEGPDDDASFESIAVSLKTSSIAKRFYFEGGGTGWSSHVLIVVDNKGQAWGMQMGYSE